MTEPRAPYRTPRVWAIRTPRAVETDLPESPMVPDAAGVEWMIADETTQPLLLKAYQAAYRAKMEGQAFPYTWRLAPHFDAILKEYQRWMTVPTRHKAAIWERHLHQEAKE